MTNSVSTTEQLNKLIEFRQAVYQSGLTQRRDAQFELVDALLISGPIQSFPDLSRAPLFRRSWSSAYAALEDGRQDEAWLRRRLVGQLPRDGAVVMGLDSSLWPRGHAPTVADCQYIYHPSKARGGQAAVGQPYSLLAWVAQPHTSWVLPVDVARIRSQTSEAAVGVQQVRRVVEAYTVQGASGHLIMAADGKYGNHVFLGGLREVACAVVARLRQDRVLYQAPGRYKGVGRRPKHGPRFAFKDPQTWGKPEADVTLEDERCGRVRLRYWGGLHARQDAPTVFGVLRVEVHLERPQPPEAIWLAWQGPQTLPETIWRYYDQRWGIEPSIKWRKQHLHWTCPQVQSAEAMDRWSWLVTLAQWEVYLARDVVEAPPLPWQQPSAPRTPRLVQRGVGGLFAQIGSPAAAPKRRGKSPGWPTGRARTRPKRHPVVKKAKKPPGKRRKAA